MFIAARHSVSAIFAIRLSSCCCSCWGSNEHRERANSKKPLAVGQQLPLAHQRELFICFSQLPLLCFACLECNLLFTVSSNAGTRPHDNRAAVQRNDSNENALRRALQEEDEPNDCGAPAHWLTLQQPFYVIFFSSSFVCTKL